MSENSLIELTLLVVLGIGAQWIGWMLRLPSILFLLIFGVLAGPVFSALHPDELFGELLMPFVSICVALILFEGGLSLRVRELSLMGTVAWKLVTLGVAITWLLGAVAAGLLLGLGVGPALLLGAVLVVTGPTVIGPLLRHIRPIGSVASILKWEGILIDPVGAVLAVLVFEALVEGQASPVALGWGILKTILVGVVFSVVAAQALVFLFRRYWIPDYLHIAATLAVVIFTFTGSNLIQHESGLLTVTLMGLILANQNAVPVRHLIEFKENLRVLILSVLFVLLAARLDPNFVAHLHWGVAGFLAWLILVVRPASVWACTLGSSLSWGERALVAWMAPRGIVAASIASVFALELEHAGLEGADQLAPLTFMVVGATVMVYGFTAAPLGRLLNVAHPEQQGVLMVGANELAREIAGTLHRHDVQVVVVDTNWDNVRSARLQGLKAYYANALSDADMEKVDFGGLGCMLAITPNDQVNTLAAIHFADTFGRMAVYQLPSQNRKQGQDNEAVAKELRGRVLFNEKATYEALNDRIQQGAKIKSTRLTEEFGFEDYKKEHANRAVPMFLIGESQFKIITPVSPPTPQPGQKVIGLVNPAK